MNTNSVDNLLNILIAGAKTGAGTKNAAGGGLADMMTTAPAGELSEFSQFLEQLVAKLSGAQGVELPDLPLDKQQRLNKLLQLIGAGPTPAATAGQETAPTLESILAAINSGQLAVTTPAEAVAPATVAPEGTAAAANTGSLTASNVQQAQANAAVSAASQPATASTSEPAAAAPAPVAPQATPSAQPTLPDAAPQVPATTQSAAGMPAQAQGTSAASQTETLSAVATSPAAAKPASAPTDGAPAVPTPTAPVAASAADSPTGAQVGTIGSTVQSMQAAHDSGKTSSSAASTRDISMSGTAADASQATASTTDVQRLVQELSGSAASAGPQATSATSQSTTSPGNVADAGSAVNIGDQITEAARSAQPNQQITIRLNPADLGEVRLTLSTRNGEVHGRIEVAEPQTLAALKNESPALAQRLAEAGVHMRRMEITLQESPQQQDFSGNGRETGAFRFEGQSQGQAQGQAQEQNARGGRYGAYDTAEADLATAAISRSGDEVSDTGINVWM